MSKYLKVLFFGCLILFFAVNAFAQRRYSQNIADAERFSAGIIFGYNGAQIDGDNFTGFDKIGLTGGIRGIARITSRLDLNIEMLYSKKGSKILSANAFKMTSPKRDRIIDLTYVDAPIFFKWLLKNQASVWHVEFGGIYSRLVNTDITEKIMNATREFSYESIVTDFVKDDISVLTGFGYTWENGFALNLRYAIGMKKFYNNKNFEPNFFGSPIENDIKFLRNYYYSLSLSYTIFRRSIKKSRS